VNPWLGAFLIVVASLVAVWLALVLALYLSGRKYEAPAKLRDVVRLLPDVVKLLTRLSKDPTLPRGVRFRLAALLVYLAIPIDLVPDFIPVIGYADDVVILMLVLRSVTRAAGVEALDRHWPGQPAGLRALKQLAGLPA
jgi:uncharacterized membrane protein YkvA (DUF1232 family)